jgi:hypothetical protein
MLQVKNQKMLFVSAEKSRKDEVIALFKSIYDCTKKSYPNGAMMLFIPTQDVHDRFSYQDPF